MGYKSRVMGGIHRKSTNVIDTRTPQGAAKHNGAMDQFDRAEYAGAERLRNPEPIGSNVDAPVGEFLETMQGQRNPARTLSAKDRKIEKDLPFFQHTTKGK